MSNYRECLMLAGAEILLYEEFGNSQGSWIAKVSYKGTVGWVEGSYGSCNVCDSFYAEFGNRDFSSDRGLSERYASFGKTYLEGMLPSEQQLEILEKRNETEMYEFVLNNSEVLDEIVLYETIVLRKNIPEKGLSKGNKGTIVEVYGDDCFEVEFSDVHGANSCVVTLSRDYFKCKNYVTKLS